MSRSNVADINLHIAAWEQAAREHRDAGEADLATFAAAKVDELKHIRVQPGALSR
jgi:hypothetical protein